MGMRHGITLTRVVEEERVVGASILNEPSHGANHVVLGRSHNGILLIVGQDDHVLPLVAISFDQEIGHVVDIVDTPAKLSLLSKVVDSDQQGLSTTCTVGVLECIALGSTVAKLLGSSGGRGAGLRAVGIGASLHRISVSIIAGRRWIGRRRTGILRLGTVAVTLGSGWRTRAGRRRTIVPLGRTVITGRW